MKMTIGLLCLLVSSMTAYAQKTEKYAGYHALEELGRGYATFDYYLKKQDTIYDGNFQYGQLSRENSKSIRRIISYKGKFDKNKLQGNWSFSMKNIDSISAKKAEGYDLISPTSGNEFLLSARFEKDDPKENWNVIKRSFLTSNPTDTLYRSNLSFTKELVKDRFEVDHKDLAVNGEFNKKGLFDGEWTIVHKNQSQNIIEIREYENGALKNHYFRINDRKVFVDYLGLDLSKETDEETWEDVAYDELYVAVLELANISSYQIDESDDRLDQLASFSSDLILNAFREYHHYKNVNIWESIDKNDVVNFNKTSVSLRRHPFSSQELEAIDAIEDDLLFIKEKLREFDDEKMMEIGEYQYKTLRKTDEIYQLISSKLGQLEKNVPIAQSDALEYLKRDDLDHRIFEEVDFPETISMDFKDEQLKIETGLPLSFDADDLKLTDLASFMERLKKRVAILDAEAQEKLDDLLKQTKLNEIEDELIEKKDKALALYAQDIKKDTFNTFHQSTAENAREFVKEKFKQYANLNLEEKRSRIDEFLACFDAIIDLYDLQSEIPSRLKRIEELYTRTVWNPYTYSDMDETVKKRIFEAYDEILVPFLLDHINKDINCEDIPTNIKNFNRLYERMVELREQDTKDIERQIKRENDPLMIFKLLSIKYSE